MWYNILTKRGSTVKINVRQQLIDYRGKPITEGENTTFRDFLTIALSNVATGETLTGEQKATAHHIEKKLYGSNTVHFTDSEKTYAKERSWKILPIVHAGRIVDILDDVEPSPILTDEEMSADDKDTTNVKG